MGYGSNANGSGYSGGYSGGAYGGSGSGTSSGYGPSAGVGGSVSTSGGGVGVGGSTGGYGGYGGSVSGGGYGGGNVSNGGGGGPGSAGVGGSVSTGGGGVGVGGYGGGGNVSNGGGSGSAGVGGSVSTGGGGVGIGGNANGMGGLGGMSPDGGFSGDGMGTRGFAAGGYSDSAASAGHGGFGNTTTGAGTSGYGDSAGVGGSVTPGGSGVGIGGSTGSYGNMAAFGGSPTERAAARAAANNPGSQNDLSGTMARAAAIAGMTGSDMTSSLPSYQTISSLSQLPTSFGALNPFSVANDPSLSGVNDPGYMDHLTSMYERSPTLGTGFQPQSVRSQMQGAFGDGAPGRDSFAMGVDPAATYHSGMGIDPGMGSLAHYSDPYADNTSTNNFLANTTSPVQPPAPGIDPNGQITGDQAISRRVPSWQGFTTPAPDQSAGLNPGSYPLAMSGIGLVSKALTAMGYGAPSAQMGAAPISDYRATPQAPSVAPAGSYNPAAYGYGLGTAPGPTSSPVVGSQFNRANLSLAPFTSANGAGLISAAASLGPVGANNPSSPNYTGAPSAPANPTATALNTTSYMGATQQPSMLSQIGSTLSSLNPFAGMYSNLSYRDPGIAAPAGPGQGDFRAAPAAGPGYYSDPNGNPAVSASAAPAAAGSMPAQNLNGATYAGPVDANRLSTQGLSAAQQLSALQATMNPQAAASYYTNPATTPANAQVSFDTAKSRAMLASRLTAQAGLDQAGAYLAHNWNPIAGTLAAIGPGPADTSPQISQAGYVDPYTDQPTSIAGVPVQQASQAVAAGPTPQQQAQIDAMFGGDQQPAPAAPAVNWPGYYGQKMPDAAMTMAPADPYGLSAAQTAVSQIPSTTMSPADYYGRPAAQASVSPDYTRAPVSNIPNAIDQAAIARNTLAPGNTLTPADMAANPPNSQISPPDPYTGNNTPLSPPAMQAVRDRPSPAAEIAAALGGGSTYDRGGGRGYGGGGGYYYVPAAASSATPEDGTATTPATAAGTPPNGGYGWYTPPGQPIINPYTGQPVTVGNSGGDGESHGAAPRTTPAPVVSGTVEGSSASGAGEGGAATSGYSYYTPQGQANIDPVTGKPISGNFGYGYYTAPGMPNIDPYAIAAAAAAASAPNHVAG